MKCVPVTSHSVVGTTYHVGHYNSHLSHNLAQYKQYIFCTTCGAYTNFRHLFKLATVCQPATLHGYGILQAIKDDSLESFLSARAVSTVQRPNAKSRKAVQFPVIHRKTDEQINACFFGANFHTSPETVAPILQPSLPITDGPTGVPPNVRDLVDLYEDGIGVVWPEGLDYESANN